MGVGWTSVGLAAALCGLLGYANVLELSRPEPVPSVTVTSSAPPKSASAERPQANAVPLTPVATYRMIVERPLFFASRRPTPPPKPETKLVASAPPPTLVLTGTLVTPDRRVALVRIGQSPEIISLEEGTDVHGWRVTEIDVDHIALVSGDERHEVWLDTEDTRDPGAVGGKSVPTSRLHRSTRSGPARP